MYITYEEYMQFYDQIEERLFNRLSMDAAKIMDNHTTGIDGVKKLRKYFPAEDYDAQSVKYCAAQLIHILHQIYQAETVTAEAVGYEATENGLHGKLISSITSGNESISYFTGSNTATAIDAAVKDMSVRNKLLSGVVTNALSGLKDVNGVNLLYMGVYPRV